MDYEQIKWPWEFHNRPDTMGGFSYKLMKAWYHADESNRMRLRRGFPWMAIADEELRIVGYETTLTDLIDHLIKIYDQEIDD